MCACRAVHVGQSGEGSVFEHVPDANISCCPLSCRSGCKVVEVQVALVSWNPAVAAIFNELVLHKARKLAL